MTVCTHGTDETDETCARTKKWKEDEISLVKEQQCWQDLLTPLIKQKQNIKGRTAKRLDCTFVFIFSANDCFLFSIPDVAIKAASPEGKKDDGKTS